MTNIEENKRMARRWLGLVSEHRIEEICAMTAPASFRPGRHKGALSGHRPHRPAMDD
jgi:hypothetical protein